MKYILSFSGGKDSTFLGLELMRRNYPLDEAVFFDTGWEANEMYAHIDKCRKIFEEHGVKFTALHPPRAFDELFEKYSWCGGPCRWGTTFKQTVLDRYFSENQGAVYYIGIAADETERLKKEWSEYKCFPLTDWGITEADCLNGCYALGFDWGGMYEHLDRLSCKFCTNKNLKELRNIRKYYPKWWEELKDHQRRTDRPYKGDGKSVFDLEKRFMLEEAMHKQGYALNNRAFYLNLKQLLAGETTIDEILQKREIQL